jgi:hypothetical protein
MGMPRKPNRPKLTWEKVRQIRELRAFGASLSQLEARFGISRQWVGDTLQSEACQAHRARTHRYELELVEIEGIEGWSAGARATFSVKITRVLGMI